MPDRPSGPVGLYDPTYEHDACGVAMVAKLDGTPSHETVERAIVALENLEHRGAAGRGSEYRRRRWNPAPAARRVHPRRDRGGSAAARRLRRLRVLPPARRGQAGASSSSCSSRPCATRASASSPGATSRSTRTTSASRPTSTRRTSSSSSWPPPTSSRTDQDAFERKLYVIRRVAEIAAGPELVIPSFSQPHDRLQGHAHQPAGPGLLPGPGRPAHEVRAGAGALAASPRTRSRAGSSRTRTG